MVPMVAVMRWMAQFNMDNMDTTSPSSSPHPQDRPPVKLRRNRVGVANMAACLAGTAACRTGARRPVPLRRPWLQR